MAAAPITQRELLGAMVQRYVIGAELVRMRELSRVLGRQGARVKVATAMLRRWYAVAAVEAHR